MCMLACAAGLCTQSQPRSARVPGKQHEETLSAAGAGVIESVAGEEKLEVVGGSWQRSALSSCASVRCFVEALLVPVATRMMHIQSASSGFWA